jgi:hypothetical protein
MPVAGGCFNGRGGSMRISPLPAVNIMVVFEQIQDVHTSMRHPTAVERAEPILRYLYPTTL